MIKEIFSKWKKKRTDNLVKLTIKKGSRLAQDGKYQEALACYNFVLKLEPENAMAWSFKGGALLQLGKIRKSKEAYRKDRDRKGDEMIKENNTTFLIVFIIWTVCLSFQPFQAIAASIADPDDEIVDTDTLLKLTTRNYKELEFLFNGYQDQYEHEKISAEQLEQKFRVFSSAAGRESQFDEWVHAYPKSYAALLARGISRVSDAWEKRGTKFVNETTDNQLNKFHERLKEAVGDLQKSLQLASRPILSYCYLLKASKGINLDVEPAVLLDDALKLDPKALCPRVNYLVSVTPKWGGSTELMNQLFEKSKQSALSDDNKKRFESKYYYYLADDAWFAKEYRAASDLYYKAYQANSKPKLLWYSGYAAFEGGLKDLALRRLTELVKEHSKYVYGYTKRGYLFETEFHDLEKAFNDYQVASNLGDSWAQNRIGWWYMNGIFVERDYDKAEQYFRLAARQNNRTAQENLAALSKLKRQVGRAK